MNAICHSLDFATRPVDHPDAAHQSMREYDNLRVRLVVLHSAWNKDVPSIRAVRSRLATLCAQMHWRGADAEPE